MVKVDITPGNSQHLLGYGARMSTGIHDHIYHRIIALDDGITQFFLISTEICIVSPVEYDRIAEQINKRLGISPVNLWWTTTHTHSAPDSRTGRWFRCAIAQSASSGHFSIWRISDRPQGFAVHPPQTWQALGWASRQSSGLGTEFRFDLADLDIVDKI